MATDSVKTTDSKTRLTMTLLRDGVENVEGIPAFQSLGSKSSSPASWLTWKRIVEAFVLSCIILIVWGLFSVPTILYALSPIQVSLVNFVIPGSVAIS